MNEVIEDFERLVYLGCYQLAWQVAAQHGLVAETRRLVTEHSARVMAAQERGINEMLARGAVGWA